MNCELKLINDILLKGVTQPCLRDRSSGREDATKTVAGIIKNLIYLNWMALTGLIVFTSNVGISNARKQTSKVATHTNTTCHQII